MSFHETNDVKCTRKEHICYGCVVKFPAGSPMQYNRGADEGGYYDYYLCHPCAKVVSKYWKEIEVDGVFEFGVIHQLIQDHQVENHDQLMASFDAQRAELMRLRKLADERNKTKQTPYNQP